MRLCKHFLAPGLSSTPSLLGPDDPAPATIREADGGWLLTVEHAGRAVPAVLGDLGLAAGEIDRHIGWDPGADELARAIHAMVGGALVEQPYSRLVIDCNRPWGAHDLVPEDSDGTAIPANLRAEEPARRMRWDTIHQPFHDEIAARVAARPRALLSVHSYDPQRRSDAATRPWPVGLLWRKENAFASHLAGHLSGNALAEPLGLNEPYLIEDESDYTIPVHAEPAGLGHVLVEVRNDFLRQPADIAAMARLFADALSRWSA